jgi:hypothetical protein
VKRSLGSLSISLIELFPLQCGLTNKSPRANVLIDIFGDLDICVKKSPMASQNDSNVVLAMHTFPHLIQDIFCELIDPIISGHLCDVQSKSSPTLVTLVTHMTCQIQGHESKPSRAWTNHLVSNIDQAEMSWQLEEKASPRWLRNKQCAPEANGRFKNTTVFIRGRCYDFLNVLDEKFSEKIGVFLSEQSSL